MERKTKIIQQERRITIDITYSDDDDIILDEKRSNFIPNNKKKAVSFNKHTQTEQKNRKHTRKILNNIQNSSFVSAKTLYFDKNSDYHDRSGNKKQYNSRVKFSFWGDTEPYTKRLWKRSICKYYQNSTCKYDEFVLLCTWAHGSKDQQCPHWKICDNKYCVYGRHPWLNREMYAKEYMNQKLKWNKMHDFLWMCKR